MSQRQWPSDHPNSLPLEDRVAECVWWQLDAAHLYRWADLYRDRGKPADPWLAATVQENAAHSARKARECCGIEELTP